MAFERGKIQTVVGTGVGGYGGDGGPATLALIDEAFGISFDSRPPWGLRWLRRMCL